MEKIEEEASRERVILDAIASTFHTLLIIHLKNNTYEVFNTHERLKSFIADFDDAQKAMHITVSNHVIPLHRKRVLEFTDLSTIEKRLAQAPDHIITENVIGISSGWVRLEFFPVDYDENGELLHIAFSIEEMENVKGWLDQCIEIADTDEITGVYNLTAFSKKIVDFSRANLPPDLGIIVIKLKTHLHITLEDHTQNDIELLGHFSSNLLEEMKMFEGTIYRTSDSEFIYIMNTALIDSAMINQILQKLAEKYRDELDFSYGIALQEKLKLNSIDFLIKSAQYDANTNNK